MVVLLLVASFSSGTRDKESPRDKEGGENIGNNRYVVICWNIHLYSYRGMVYIRV